MGAHGPVDRESDTNAEKDDQRNTQYQAEEGQNAIMDEKGFKTLCGTTIWAASFGCRKRRSPGYCIMMGTGYRLVVFKITKKERHTQ